MDCSATSLHSVACEQRFSVLHHQPLTFLNRRCKLERSGGYGMVQWQRCSEHLPALI